MRWHPVAPSVVLLIVLLCTCWVEVYARDPYQVLGLSRTAPQADIKQSYRKLCLKYHPDKNRSNPRRKEFESRFKDVQEAYERIGTAESRQQYDLTTRFSGYDHAAGSRSANNSQGRSGNTGQQRGSRHFSQQQRAYYTTSDFFTQTSGKQRGTTSPMTFDDIMRAYQKMFDERTTFNGSSFPTAGSQWTEGKESIFHQRVTMPLEELYHGKDHFEFQFGEKRPWSGLVAAFRGGAGPIYLYRSILYALPLYKLSPFLVPAVAVYFFYQFLPKPKGQQQFSESIPSGCKGGTIFQFQDETDSTVKYQFEVVPLKHEYFRLEGGDTLWTTFTVSPQNARRGCTVKLKGLAGNPIHVRFPPKLKDGQVLTVPHEGWPRASNYNSSRRTSGQSKGDLRIQVRISSKRQGQSG